MQRRLDSFVLSAIAFSLLCVTGAVLAAGPPANDNSYEVTLLVSNVADEAPVTDAKLVNAWGIAASATSPWWVSNNGSNSSTIYSGDGVKTALEVDVPDAPTGIVSYPATGTQFHLSSGLSAHFIWATESGTVFAWRSGTSAEMVFSAANAVYKGLAIHGDTLYASDFGHCAVQALDGTFAPITTPGGFHDDSVAKDYCPFGIQTVGDAIFVTYALRGGLDDIAGVGHGFVREFDTNGNLVAKVATHGTLNSPWGMAMAPADFGKFSSCLLVGNFGDGLINAFCPGSGPRDEFRPAGRLHDKDNKGSGKDDDMDADGDKGSDVRIDGLWGLGFGNGAASGPVNVLYFAAGPNDESNGHFGKIEFAPKEKPGKK